MQALTRTNYKFDKQKNIYHGKVRDVYNIDDDLLVMIVTDRISAFDVVLPRGIPYKGQVLNQIASKFLDETSDIVPNWKIASPDPMVTVGHFAEPYKVEMVIRGYLTGHAWREYRDGKRKLCGIPLAEGMRENQKFEKPIITPTSKAETGHDEDLSREEILEQGLVPEYEYNKLEEYTYKLFERGTRIAEQMGLILVDTKYEFGKKDGNIYLIDEINTPDSSRYFYREGYEYRFTNNQPQKQLSKEFVRQWLISKGFQGKEGQTVPEMTDDFIEEVSERYIELFENITGDEFVKAELENLENRIENNINKFLAQY